MNKTTMFGADAAAEVLDSGILVVRWRGLVTMRAAEATKAAICAALPAHPLGVVSDYAGAAVAMSDAELVQIMMGGRHDLAELPAVVVAGDGACDAMYRASITAAASGLWRYVSREHADALHVAHQLADLGVASSFDR